MSEMFASPASSAAFDLDAALGDLLVIEPTAYEREVATVHGETDAIRARVIDVTNPDLSTEDALIFPRMLVGALRPRIGQRVLGRLAKGTPKPGKSAPWVLEDAVGNAVDVKAAQKALAALDGKPKPAQTRRATPAPARDDEIPF